jgi:hypothetical protein
MVLSQKTVQMMHNNTRPDDTQLTFTTLGWMMWNHMLSTLGCGACMAAYDGSPFAPSPSTIWAIAERFKITILGLSPRYLQTLETGGYVPNKEFDLRHVRQIQLAGSVLKPELYDCESGRGYHVLQLVERCARTTTSRVLTLISRIFCRDARLHSQGRLGQQRYRRNGRESENGISSRRRASC